MGGLRVSARAKIETPLDEDLCRWQTGGVRAVKGRHTGDCPDPEACTGCLPCPRPHCRVCGEQHALSTCIECVETLADELDELVGLYAHDLLGQAVIDSTGHDPAESEALALRGPVAHQEAWYYLRDAGKVLDDRDPRNPLWVLGTWELVVREWLDEEAATTARVTVHGAAEYIKLRLPELADQADVPVDTFATELRDCLVHVRSVVGDRVELRKQCPKCGRRTLVRRWQRIRGGYQPGNENRIYRDVWRCRRNECAAEWTDTELRTKVEAAFVKHADRLTLRDLEERTGIPGGTLRRWASPRRIQPEGESVQEWPAVLRASGRSPDGRKLFRVSDVEDLQRGVCPWTPRHAEHDAALDTPDTVVSK